MNEPVDRLLAEREHMDRGFQASFVLSVAAHLVLLGTTVAAAIFGSKAPLLQVQDGFAVPLPAGGGGVRSVEPPAPAVAKPEPEATQAPPVTAPPPKILKPPKDEPKKGLPELDAKKSKAKPTPAPVKAGGSPGGTGTATETQGLGLQLPPGAGIPNGSDVLGDWYLAGVQRKIWLLWANQIRTGMAEPAIVSFTIMADGSLGDVQVVQTCGVTLLDFAARRAIYSAAPFGPLPRNYGTNQLTIQGIFKPGN